MPGKAPIEPKKGNNFPDGSHNILPTENPYRKKERVGMGIYTQGWVIGWKEDNILAAMDSCQAGRAPLWRNLWKTAEILRISADFP